MTTLVLAMLAGGCALSSDIAVSTSQLPEARVAMAYEATLEAVEPRGEVSWALEAGALPPGLTLDEATGSITGEPTLSGTWVFSVVAMDDRGEAITDLIIEVPPVLLASGFGPFEGYPVNPSIEALWELDGARVGVWDVRVLELPVTWAGAWPPLLAEIDRLSPTVVLGTGVADTDYMRFENLALNRQELADVDGELPPDTKIVPGGETYLQTGLPTEEMAAAVEALGYPARQSSSAGTYLCNHIFYHLMDLALERPELVTGFVHVPPAPSASFEISDITAAHEASLGALEDYLHTGQSRRASPDVTEAPTYRGAAPRP